jgi:cell division initiation protein
MKITPLEIRQKTFEKHFRGYDKDEVTSFLSTLSQEWEKLMDEKKELQSKLEYTEREAAKLKEVESSLYRTLKTAEDTGANIIEQATATADQLLKEAQTDAQLAQSDAKQRSQNMIEAAEAKSKEIMGNLRKDLQELINNYEDLVKQRKKLVSNLQELAGKTLSSIEEAEASYNKIDIHAHTELLEDLSEGGSLEKLVEEQFQQVGSEIKSSEPEISSSEVVFIDNTHKPSEEVKEEKKKEPQEDIPVANEQGEENLSEEEEKEAAIKEAEKQFKVHEPKPTYFDERPKSVIEKKAMEKKNQSGSFFDQFE